MRVTKSRPRSGQEHLSGARDLVVRQRTQLSNLLRGLLGEFGIVIAQGVGSAVKFAKAVLDGAAQVFLKLPSTS